MLEKIQIPFENGVPVMPTIVAGPQVIEKLKENMQKMTEEEKKEFERKKQKIYEKKYEEYLSTENNRKLVD